MRSNRGMTILEVLFAIMITTVGLLGAIAVFPVAANYARKGILNDDVTVLTETAVHKFDSQGMRRPDRWIAFVDGSGNNQAATPYSGSALPTSFPGSFWKTSFCIDPRFTASNMTAHANNEQRWCYFPAFPQASNLSPRMQRVTLVNGMAGSNPPYAPAFVAMNRLQADFAFGFADHLSYERPGVQKGTLARSDNAAPAFQLYSPIKDASTGKMIQGKREDDGKLSWMVTAVPKMDLAYGSRPNEYILSTVVFYQRSPQMVTRDFNLAPPVPPFAEDTWPDNEWTVSIAGTDFYGSGNGGGEVRMNADWAEKLNTLKSGQWVMLAGNAPALPDANGNYTSFAPIFKWYRISDVDEIDVATINGNSRAVRTVTLVGPDWDWYDLNKDGIADDVEVTVMPGVVNVFERTVPLEWDGAGY